MASGEAAQTTSLNCLACICAAHINDSGFGQRFGAAAGWPGSKSLAVRDFVTARHR
jgi:hypothetical protein